MNKALTYRNHQVSRFQGAEGGVRGASAAPDNKRSTKFAAIDALYGSISLEESFAIAKRAGILTANGKLTKRFR